MAIYNLCIIQVSLFCNVSRAARSCIDVSSSSWLCLILIHVILFYLSVISARTQRNIWSFCRSLWRFSWFRRRLILDLFESISDSWLAFIHGYGRIIFIEGRGFLICLYKLLLIEHLMIATESGRALNKRRGRIFTNTWRLFGEIILQLPLILRTIALNVWLGLVASLPINLWISWLLGLRYLRLQIRRWFLLTQIGVWIFARLFIVSIYFFRWWFRKIARNSCVWIKAVDIWFMTWGGDTFRIMHIMTATVSVVVTIDSRIILVLTGPMIFCSRAICFRKGLVSLGVIRVPIISMVCTVFHITFLMPSRSICTFSGATLVLLCLCSWSLFVGCCTTWALIFLKHATTHMKGRLMQTEIILDVILCNSVLWLSFTGLFEILFFYSWGAWSLLMVICVLIKFCGVIILLGLNRALRLVQMIRLRMVMINTRSACMAWS